MLSTMPKPEISSPLRTLAFLSLAFDLATGVLLWLTVAFPSWGIDSQFVPLFYIPPQAYAMALAGLIAMLLTATTGLAGLVVSLSRRQRMWSLVFLVGFLVAIQGPILIGLQLHDSSTLQLSQAQETLSTAASVVAFILLSLLSLVYAQRRIPTSREATN
jgi:hypothetical protein